MRTYLKLSWRWKSQTTTALSRRTIISGPLVQLEKNKVLIPWINWQKKRNVKKKKKDYSSIYSLLLFIVLKNTQRSQRVRYFRVTAKINSKGERLFSWLREVVAQVAHARDACGTKVSRGQNGAKTRAVRFVLYGRGRPHRCWGCRDAFNDRRKPHRARLTRAIVTYFNLKYIDL